MRITLRELDLRPKKFHNGLELSSLEAQARQTLPEEAQSTAAQAWKTRG